MKYPAYPVYRETGIPFLPKLPEGWQLKRLRFASQGIEQGWSPQCDNNPAEDNAWGVMKVGCVNGNRFDPTENKALPADLEPLPEYELRPGDVLISRANTKELVGSAAVVPDDVRSRLLLCDKLFRLHPEPDIDKRFLTYFLRTPAARYQYERDATGASGSMQNIGQDIIKNLILPMPVLNDQVKIADFLDWKTARVDELIDKKQIVSSTLRGIGLLDEYRTALITAAVTGQIDVRDVANPAAA